MIEEQAIVLKVEGAVAHLEIARAQPCGLCGTTRGCGVSLWGRLFGHRVKPFSVKNTLAAVAGDHVVIGVDESLLLTGSLRAYLLPVVLVCLGGFIGSSAAAAPHLRDLSSIIGALAGLMLGLAVLRYFGRGASTGLYNPVMLRRAVTASNRHCIRGDK